MDRKGYSKVYNQSKRELRDSINRFAEQNPERFAELQKQALHELEHPPERQIIRYPIRITGLSIDEIVTQFRAGRKDYYVHTVDCWKDEHLYFEMLSSPEEATEVMTRRHPKFTEREERVVKVEPCVCPLCI